MNIDGEDFEGGEKIFKNLIKNNLTSEIKEEKWI